MFNNMTSSRTGLAVLVLLLLLCPPIRAEVDFERLNGADLGIGVGARAIGMAGAFTAVADDASAFFWNPAGLTQLDGHELFVSADIPADFSAAALVYKSRRPPLQRHGFAAGVALVDRLSFKGDSGDGTWEGYPSHLLDLAMIDIDSDYSGRIDSRTFDARLFMAMTVPKLPRLDLGFNLAHIW